MARELTKYTDADAESLERKWAAFTQSLTLGEVAALVASLNAIRRADDDVKPYIYGGLLNPGTIRGFNLQPDLSRQARLEAKGPIRH